jgi:hypothetical protein
VVKTADLCKDQFLLRKFSLQSLLIEISDRRAKFGESFSINTTPPPRRLPSQSGQEREKKVSDFNRINRQIHLEYFSTHLHFPLAVIAFGNLDQFGSRNFDWIGVFVLIIFFLFDSFE